MGSAKWLAYTDMFTTNCDTSRRYCDCIHITDEDTKVYSEVPGHFLTKTQALRVLLFYTSEIFNLRIYQESPSFTVASFTIVSKKGGLKFVCRVVKVEEKYFLFSKTFYGCYDTEHIPIKEYETHSIFLYSNRNVYV